jgi:hypothetical protein
VADGEQPGQEQGADATAEAQLSPCDPDVGSTGVQDADGAGECETNE